MLQGIFGILAAVLLLVASGVLSVSFLEEVKGPRSVDAPVSTTTKTVATTTQKKPVSVSPAAPKKTTVAQPIKSGTNTTVAVTSSKTVAAPGPLRVTTQANGSATLSVLGVIEETNKARLQNGGFGSLVENATLDRVAQLKLADMFARQYFEHVSPTGVGPADLARNAGYAYVVVGENLALGDFGSDAKLVDAWMNSPGHRANILNAHYQEIGVAVGKGMYEGRETWLAVQSFGLPLSACPAVDTALKAQIDANNLEIERMRVAIDAKKSVLDAASPYDPNYNTYVNEFNTMIAPYNELVQSNKALVANYNTTVQAFNTCISAASGTH